MCEWLMPSEGNSCAEYGPDVGVEWSYWVFF